MSLQNCPHCASAALVYPDGDMEGYRVMCSGDKDLQNQCPSGVFGYPTQLEADDAWNKRCGAVPASDTLVEALTWLEEHLANPNVDMSSKLAHLSSACRAAGIPVKSSPSPISAPVEEIKVTQYTVVAYRWGNTNSHRYLVGATQNLARAIEIANTEADFRGGKYGVSVYAWSSEDKYERVHYAPSLYGEDQPKENHRIEMFQSIGHCAHALAVNGTVFMTDPNDHDKKNQTLKFFEVEVPAWLDHIVRNAETQAFWGSRSLSDIRQRQKDGLPAMTEEEQKAWFESIDQAAKTHVNAIFDRRDALLKKYKKRKPQQRKR